MGVPRGSVPCEPELPWFIEGRQRLLQYRYWKEDGEAAAFSKIEPIDVVYGFPYRTKFNDLAEVESRKSSSSRLGPVTLTRPGRLRRSGIRQHFHPRDVRSKLGTEVRQHRTSSGLERRFRSLPPFSRRRQARHLDRCFPRSVLSALADMICTRRFQRRSRNPRALKRHRARHALLQAIRRRYRPAERVAHEALLHPTWLEHPRRPATKFVDVWRLIHGPAAREWTCVPLLLSLKECADRETGTRERDTQGLGAAVAAGGSTA